MKIQRDHAKAFATVMEKESDRFFENGVWVEGSKLVMITNGATLAVVENVTRSDSDIDRQLIEKVDFLRSLAIAEAVKDPCVDIAASQNGCNTCPPLADKVDFVTQAAIEFDLDILDTIVKLGKAARKARGIKADHKFARGHGRNGTVRLEFKDRENWSGYMARVKFSGIMDMEAYACPRSEN